LTSYQAGTPLATLANMTDLIFRGTVDEIDVGKLREGLPARLRSGPARRACRRPRLQDRPEVEERRRRDAVRDRDRASAGQRRGPARCFSANADVAIKEKHGVLLLPERLVTSRTGAPASRRRARATGRAGRKDIQVGLSDGINIEVTQGLSERPGRGASAQEDRVSCLASEKRTARE